MTKGPDSGVFHHVVLNFLAIQQYGKKICLIGRKNSFILGHSPFSSSIALLEQEYQMVTTVKSTGGVSRPVLLKCFV